METGTSMASPYAAGLVARLNSALIATNRRASARMLRQALRMGARQLPSGSIVDQGAGLPDIGAAWSWLAAAHDLPGVAVDAAGIAGRAGIYLTSAAAATGARVVLRELDGGGPLTLRLRSDSSWLQVPETVAMTNGVGEFTAQITVPALAASGVTSTAIRVEGPDETAGPVAVIPVVIRTPIPDAGTRAAIPVEQPIGTHPPAVRSCRQRPRVADRGGNAARAPIRSTPHCTNRAACRSATAERSWRGLVTAPGSSTSVAATWSPALYEVDVMAGPACADHPPG